MLLEGQVFGKYRLLKRLAVGGQAEVFAANLAGVADFNKLVVVKQLLGDRQELVELFLDEGRLAARLAHPNIAHTFDLGEVDGQFYIAMEYIIGETLGAILKHASAVQRELPLAGALRIILELLDALEYAHTLRDEEGRPLHIVHRDVSPSNLMVTFQGAVKLVDFGIARASTQRHVTQAGAVRGKVGYMSPEQCTLGPLDHRTDVFAAGAILYRLVTGAEPYPGDAQFFEALAQMREARFAPPRQARPSLPVGLESIIVRAMARNPQDRFQSAAAMQQALESFVEGARLYPKARELGEFVGSLFPNRARRVGGADETADVRSLLEDVGTRDLHPPAAPEATTEASPARAARAVRWRRPVAGAVLLLLTAAAAVVWARANRTPPAPALAPAAAVAPVADPVPPPPPEARESAPPVNAAPAPARVPEPSRRKGRLVLDSYPWSSVREGNRELGRTPLQIELPAGRHHLLLDNAQLRRHKWVWVEVKEDQEISMYEDLGP